MAIKKVRIKNGTPIDVNDARINGIDSTPTLNSTNVVMSGGVKSALDGITDKIPAQASSTNQLADKAFVNSSIETATAEFKGTFNSLAELEQVTADNNDYGFVISTDASGNTVYNRYKYNGTEWLFEYSLNNSSFTAAQWAAIQSGITSALVTKLNGIADGAEVNVQSDWNAESGDAFIKNKPQNLVQDADYVHTDNNYTTTEKNKLSGIESGAQKNAAGTVVDANYVHTDNNYTDAEKTKLSGISSGAEVNVLNGVKVNGVEQTATEKKVDISVPTSLSQLSDDASHRVVSDSEKSAWSGKYDKPSGGIPESDLSTSVQSSLSKADTALQAESDPTVPAWAKAASKPSYSYSEISDKPTLGTAAAKDVPSSGDAGATQVVMGNDSRLSDSRPASDVSDWAKAGTKPTYTRGEVGLGNVTNDAQVKRTEMGAASGVATLGSDGKVPASQLPSYVDDVLEYANRQAFPETGESGKIYVALDTNKTFRWSGSAYVEISPSLVIGTTTGTAYDGGSGQALADKLSGIENGAQVNVLDGVKVNGVAQTITDKKVDISVPTALSQLSADATHRVVTDTEKSTWNGKYTKPSGGIPASDLASGVIPDVSQFIEGQGVKNIISLTKAEYDALANKDSETIYVVEDSHDYVDLGLRDGNGQKILFATCNIGASAPQEYGDYFAWGETSKRYTSISGSSIVGGSFEWSNCPYHTGSTYNTGWSKYIPTGKESYGTADNKLTLEAGDDVASVLWGGNWRMPDKSDLEYLISDNVTYSWTNNYNGTGVSGFIITGKGSFSSASLFLPAAGYCDGTDLYDAGDYGYYWSRSVHSDDPSYAWSLYFEDGYQRMDGSGRYFGPSVRPVHVGDVVPSYKLYKGSNPINKAHVSNNTLYL